MLAFYTIGAMDIVGAIIVAAFFFGVYWFAIRHAEWKKIWNALVNEIGLDKRDANFKAKYSTKTPGGAPVISVAAIPQKALQNLDIGLQNMIARHKREFPNSHKYLTIPEFAFVFIEPAGTTVETDPGAPYIKAMGIPTAGTSIGLGPFPLVDHPYIVLPHQEAQNWSHMQYLANTSWYEAEHVHERFLDESGNGNVDIFMSFSGANDKHPHYDFPDIEVIPAVL